MHLRIVAFRAAFATLVALGACHHEAPEGLATGPGVTATRPSPGAPSDASATNAPASDVTEIAITVDGEGYHPEEIKAPAGKLARLKFTRTSDSGCGQQVLFPALKLQKDLPLGREVVVELTVPASGRLEFTCGMGMLRGVLVAKP